MWFSDVSMSTDMRNWIFILLLNLQLQVKSIYNHMFLRPQEIHWYNNKNTHDPIISQ